MHCLPQRLRSTLFEIFWTERFRRAQRSEKKFQTTLILVFEVIVQPHKAHFLTFSSETKIMKITHSADGWCFCCLLYLRSALLLSHLFDRKTFFSPRRHPPPRVQLTCGFLHLEKKIRYRHEKTLCIWKNKFFLLKMYFIWFVLFIYLCSNCSWVQFVNFVKWAKKPWKHRCSYHAD